MTAVTLQGLRSLTFPEACRLAVGAAMLCMALGACGRADGDPARGDASPSSIAPSVTPTESAVTPSPGDHELTLIHDGVQREYLLHAPPGYDTDTPMPLVLALHGRPSSPDSFQSLTGLSDEADEAGFVVVYPAGVNGGWVVTGAGADDVGFISALIDTVERTWGTDPDRIYVTGFSNGAQMTFRLAAELSDRLAAVAPISGAPRGDLLPSSPISVMSITGDADKYANYAASDLIRSWHQALGCAPLAEAENEIGDYSVTTMRAECPQGTDLLWHSVDGMGHSWPGSSGGSLSAVDLIWDFFEAHTRSATN